MEATSLKSVRKLSQQMHLSYGTNHTILKKDLKMFPYKVQVYQKILPGDFVPRKILRYILKHHFIHEKLVCG
ncbi:hypothetical protein BDFB_011997, partial [Asbolus verrucosus]